ncbi:MAG: PP2C family protein-serine/threonine phosphatase [Planctomycetota bacterium]
MPGAGYRVPVVAGPGVDHAEAVGLAGRMLAAWPRADRKIETGPVIESDALTGPGAPVLAVAGGTPDNARSVIESMRRVGRAGVVLVEDASLDALRREEHAGVVVEPVGVEPAHAASTLFTLFEREQAVQEMRLELRACRLGAGDAADKLHEELQLASVVQREFVPETLPEIEGMDLGVLYRPASYVSGDLYDVVRLDEHRVGMMIADAVGHGVPAALLTMVISKGLRKIEHEADGTERVLPPAEAVEWLNRELCLRQGAAQRFATGVYAVIDTQTWRVTLSGAGHPFPLVVSRDGSVRQVETEGPLLGVFDGAEYDQTSFTLEPGETLLMYSDGFETAFPRDGSCNMRLKLPNTDYLKHLADAASGSGSDHPLAEAMAKLAAKLDEQAGSLHQPDDVTAVALSRSLVGSASIAA